MMRIRRCRRGVVLAELVCAVLAAVLVAGLLLGTRLRAEPATEQATGSGWLQEAQQKVEPHLWPSYRGILKRIAGQVDGLRKESVEETLANLSQPYMYFWPGWSEGGAGLVPLPLEREAGRWTLESIKSNRRFLKACQDLSALPKAEAARLVSAQIEASLPLYQQRFERVLSGFRKALTRARERDPELKDYGAGFGHQATDNPDGSPTLTGLRFQLLGLVLVAGDLGLEEARPAVLAVLEEALRQRDRFYDREQLKELRECDRFIILDQSSLYHRQVLATGLLGISGEPGQADSLRQRLAVSWEQSTLTPYDALATPYDRYLGIRADFSQGAVTVRYVGPLGDEEFDRVVVWARSQDERQ